MTTALRSLLCAVLLATSLPALAARDDRPATTPRTLLRRIVSPIKPLRASTRALNRLVKPSKHEAIGPRAADAVAKFAGSWKFISSFSLGMAAWIAYNTYAGPHAFDPAPFIGLNLLLSTVAALQAPFILMSQNRQADKDRVRQEEDLAVNIQAEQEIQALHGKVDQLSDQIRLLSEQLGAQNKSHAPPTPLD